MNRGSQLNHGQGVAALASAGRLALAAAAIRPLQAISGRAMACLTAA